MCLCNMLKINTVYVNICNMIWLCNMMYIQGNILYRYWELVQIAHSDCEVSLFRDIQKSYGSDFGHVLLEQGRSKYIQRTLPISTIQSFCDGIFKQYYTVHNCRKCFCSLLISSVLWGLIGFQTLTENIS